MTNDVQPTQDTDQPPQIEGTLSVQEAAVHYGVTEKTIRRRIKTGSLRAVKHAIAEGFEWRVYPGEGSLDSAMGTQPTHAGTQARQEAHTAPEPQAELSQSAELLRALDLVERMTQRNEQLAGQVGFLQAKVQDQERQIALLMAPKDEPAEEPPAESEPRQSWWRRLIGGR